MAKQYDGEIPFSRKTGDQLHYADRRWDSATTNWVENFLFSDVLTYKGYARGRSAAYFMMERESNKTEVVVFMTDFEAMIPLMVRGKINGIFTHCKRGMNFGCKLVSVNGTT